MSIIKKYLGKFVDKEIIIVQIDGNAFKGKLREYDEEFLLIENVIQTSTKQHNWFKVTVAVPTSTSLSSEKLIDGTIVGDTESKLLELTTALISVNQVMRIWLWEPNISAAVKKKESA
jgi:small nuclear ribonucleoprotein (snRNP)-like protein